MIGKGKIPSHQFKHIYYQNRKNNYTKLGEDAYFEMFVDFPAFLRLSGFGKFKLR